MARKLDTKRSIARTRSVPAAAARSDSVLVEVRGLIIEARQQTARMVNAGLTLLYWQVGNRIQREILKERRAEYGAEIVRSLSAQLEMEFGRGFGEKSLRRMVQFAEAFPDPQIVATLSRQLGWSHFREILPLADPLQREFYAEMCRLTELPPRDLLEKRLHEAVARARRQIERQAAGEEAGQGL